MKIRTQLIAGIVVFALLLVIISGFIISTNQQLDRLRAQEDTANSIALEVGELSYLSEDYILYRETRQADRWNAKYDSIAGEIARLDPESPEQRAIASSLATSLKNTKSVFNEIASSPLQTGTADSSFIQISWSRMAVQNQGMIFDAGRLARLLRHDEDAVSGARLFFIFALMGTFVAFLLTSYLVFYRRTLRSIGNLQTGVKSVGSGDFSNTIDETADDEIGDLARSFNRMVSDLKTVTASKAELEKEVRNRVRAEEDLVYANDRLIKSEQDLIQLNTDLNAINEELTATQGELHRIIGKLSLREQDLLRSQAELKDALAEKEILLSEIHHRVKNNLAAFISLLSLDGTYEETEAGLALRKDLQNRARSMALIHETLYRTGKFSNVDMEIYLSTLIGQIASTWTESKRIRTAVDGGGIVLDLARATTAGLIVNELVTNSFKYAFPPSFDCKAVRGEPCTIRVVFSQEESTYLLSVADNGRGLPEDFDPLVVKSLGLRLVTFLARHQLRAEITVRRDRGTEFIFRLKKPEDRS